MSNFGKSASIETTVVMHYRGKLYFTPEGITGVLADDAADRIISRQKNDKKYGRAIYNTTKSGTPPMTPMERWKANMSRLRKKYTRRALPILLRVFLAEERKSDEAPAKA
jgi:hypothetical protein